MILLLLLLLQKHLENELCFQQIGNIEIRSDLYRFYNFWPLFSKSIRQNQTCYL